MNKNSVIAIAAIAAALAGCSSPMGSDLADARGKKAGTVEFHLDLPNGEATDEIVLDLVCDSGIDQTHLLDVVDGEVVAAFGGLEGHCTATMHAITEEGTDCDGSTMFDVVAGAVTPVTVVLVCQGYNGEEGGGATIETDFVVRECDDDRILKLYAIPSNLLEGESTNVEAEGQNLVGTAMWSFEIGSASTGEGSLSSGAPCAADSAACMRLACDGIGTPDATPDAETGLPISHVWVAVTVEDTECRDTEVIRVDCLQGSVCGDGVESGVEECDQGSADQPPSNGDGCTDQCRLEFCGDGVVNNAGAEECDGTAGFDPATQGCSATCTITALPRCGDGVRNQASEQCDGADGLANPAVQQCGAAGTVNACTIVPICPNGIVEAGEACDDGPGGSATCSATCQPIAAADPCLTCIENIPDVGAYYQSSCETDPLCSAALQCIVATNCWVPTASFCYCGGDADACEADSYVPTGPCRAEIIAGLPGLSTNATRLAAFFAEAYPMGIAGQILTEANTACPATCFADPARTWP